MATRTRDPQDAARTVARALDRVKPSDTPRSPTLGEQSAAATAKARARRERDMAETRRDAEPAIRGNRPGARR